MKKTVFLVVSALISASTVSGQCSGLFSFAANFETVNFFNQSTVSNAHYFWNFDDGTGSNLKDPIHKFPETGNFFVTLFAKDTLSNCSSSQTIQLQRPGQTITGIKAYGPEKNLLSVYPNPARHAIVVSNAIEAGKITLADSFGREVLVLDRPQQGQYIDLSHLPAGVYLLKAASGQGRAVFKVLKG